MPLEQDISEGVLKHFPDLQRTYAPLEAKLAACGLPGADRASDLQDSLTEILKGDASDATPRLGAEKCPLFDSLLWAREVQKAFANGIESSVGQLRRHLKDIEELPAIGATGDLVTSTTGLRADAAELLKREDFFTQMPAIQTALKNLQVAVRDGCKALAAGQTASLDREVNAIESMFEWTKLGAEQQNAFSERLDKLKITVTEDLDGIRKLLNHQFTISTELERIKAEIRVLTKPKENGGTKKPSVEMTISLPKEISSVEEVDDAIAELEKVRVQLNEYEKVTIKWQ